MRSLVTYAVAALAALGLLAASAAASQASLASCDWQPIGIFPNLAPRALAVTTDGGLLLAADDLNDPAHGALTTLRWDATGGWQIVDRFLPADASSTGARALHVDPQGNVYVLAWEVRGPESLLLIRRSFSGGAEGTWESSETTWPNTPGGALGSDLGGRIYVAHGLADARGVGWRVESAPRATGAFRIEDDLRLTGISAALPQAFARGDDGTLYVAGQLDGSPDEWLVRARAVRGARRKAAWQTIDRYLLSPTSYGLMPRAIVPLANRVLVAGAGVRGNGEDDYAWIERWQSGKGKWQTRRYQVQNGLTTMALDAVAAPEGGAAVLGVGTTSRGLQLVLRESGAGLRNDRLVLAVDGVTNLQTARIAVGDELAGIVASIQDKMTVLGCTLR